MTDTAQLVCAACRLSPFPADAPRDAASGLPHGWVVRLIAGRTYTLCDCCGDIRHFKGGISTYLQESLGVSEHAKCDFGDEQGGGLHRNRVKKR